MASNFNNISITGDYTGTVTKTFKIVIVITGQTVQFKQATKDEGAEYGSFSSLINITLNSAISIGSGLSATFTASSLLDYNNNDTWYFTAHPNLDLGEVKYSKMETLQRQDETDLVLFSKDGDVAIIEDYDNTPSILLNQGNVGQFTTFDVEKKNKELYVALGQSSSPKWVGYLKNIGLGTDNNERFIVDNTIDSVNSNYDPRNEIFDKFIVLRNGEANTENSKCIVGIKDNEPCVYIYNITTGSQKVIKYTTDYVPTAIRPWYGNNSGSPNYYCEGFILLCNREQSNEIAELQFWSIETEGTDANIGTSVNKDKTINIRRPSVDGGSQIDRYHDFLVVPSSNDLSSATYTLMLVADRDSFSPEASWLYKVEHNNFYTKINNDDIVASNILDITPLVNFDNLSNNNDTGHDAVWHWGMVSPIKPITNNNAYDGNDKHKFVIAGSFEGVTETRQIIQNFPKNSLQFGGFDGGGGNPVVLFTCKFRAIETISIQKRDVPTSIFSSSELSDWNNYSFQGAPIKFTGPFLSDDATLKTNKRYKPVEWGTYAIPLNSTNGRFKHKLFAHLNQSDVDEDQIMQKFASLYPQATEFSNMIASGEDNLFLSGGGGALSKVVPSRICIPYKGSMYLYGDRGASGARMGMVFWSYENQEYVHFRWSSEGAGKGISYANTDVIDVFPSTVSANYTRWNTNHSSATDIESKAINTHYFKYTLPTNLQSSSQVKDTWVIGEGSRTIAINSSFWYANATEAFFSNRILTGEDTTRRLVKVDFGNGAFTNQIQQSENLLKIESNSTQPNDDWIGENAKKVYYRVSFLYDGYQESALMQTTLTRTNVDNSNNYQNIDKAIAIDLKINKESILNQRITDIVLYRGLSSNELGVEPEGLYRFVDQIKLKDFNLATGEDYYVATVTDRGKSGATYESLNGISELSYSLEVNYTLNAEQNGYMFIGNCEHSQFEDASNVIFRSQSGKYSIFDWASDFVTLPFIPTALQGFMGKIYAFSHTQLAIINAENLFIEDIIEGVGCIGPDAIKVTDSGMLFCDYKNIYLSTPKIISIGEIIKEVDDDGWNKLGVEEKNTIVIGYDAIRNAYLLFYTRGTNHRCWAFSVRSKRWDFWETPNKVLSSVEDKDGHCILLLDNNQIVKYLAGPNKRNFEWESKKLTFGYDMQEKRIRNVKIATNDKNNTNIQYKVDGYEGSWQDGTDISSNFTGSNTIAIKLNNAHGVKHHWIKYKVTGTNDSSASDKKVFAISTIYKAKRYK